jgi:hypothetical protein
MTSRLVSLALLALAACGAPADAPVEVDSSSRSMGDEPVESAATTARASSSASSSASDEPAASAEVAAAPVELDVPAAAPAPTAPPPVAPLPPPVTPPAAEPEPTPDHPLIIDCRSDGHGCSDCTAQLRAEHPDWFESGAAACVLRDCDSDSDCASLGADLVCRPWAAPGDAPVCRLPRLASYQLCDPAIDNVCEVGLWCQPSSPARCRPLP